MGFQITVVGLGLMGASMAQALRGFQNARIAGMDADEPVRRTALAQDMVDCCYAEITEAVKDADLILFCVYARHIPELLRQCLPVVKQGALLSDICGVKTPLYQEILPMIPKGAGYIGIHPMAGRERDGIEHADAGLYAGSSLLICPTNATRPEHITLMKELAGYLSCARAEVVAYQKHDEIIAYTSDLMHIAAAGLCVRYHPDMSLAFAAGAFRDCTRIADINETAWTELLLENRENVSHSLEQYIKSLNEMNHAICANDSRTLQSLLKQAGDHKREMLKR